MRYLITAGPTREPIDAVRYISNRSSGQMGVALAQAGAAAGHDVTLLLGPSHLAEPADCRVLRFDTGSELQQLLQTHWPRHDVLIMAAAVADYRPVTVHHGKMRRGDESTTNLALRSTDDLAATAAANKRPDQRVVAFALEPAETLIDGAKAKLRRKGVDAIVANPLEAMDAPDIDATWLSAHGARQRPGAMSKAAFARWMIDNLPALLGL